MKTISSDRRIRARCACCGRAALAEPSNTTFGLWHADLPCGSRVELVGPRAKAVRREDVLAHVLVACGEAAHAAS